MNQALRIIGSPGRERIDSAVVELWSPGTRLVHGAKVLGVCWLISAITIFVPVAHFILVPLFFLGGIAGIVWRARQKGVFRASRLTCPQCEHNLGLDGELFELPLYRECPGCSQRLFIEASQA